MEGRGVLTITTRLDEKVDEVLVSVGDTGKGIDPEVMPRLFEPFYTTKPVGEGVGLGLSTSYGIVKRHNGRIEVDSEPGKGSVFTVHLPLEGPEQE
jgi:two-component system NtrC family sensor kinase